MATETGPPRSPEPAPPKFSRYRTVRRAQAAQQQQPSPAQEPPPVPMLPQSPQRADTAVAAVSRSMSRYHRRPTASAPKVLPLHSELPEENAVAVPPSAAEVYRSRALDSLEGLSHGEKDSSPPPQPRLPNTSRYRAEATNGVAKAEREPSQTTRDEARALVERETERHRVMREQQKAQQREHERLRQEEDEAARRKAQREAEEVEEVLRQKETQERGRKLLQAESAARAKKREEEARRAQLSPTSSPHRHLGLFHRKRKDYVSASPEAPAPARTRQTSDTSSRDMSTIRPGGGGAVLGIDAPISAINAGDRRVLVVCNKHEIYLPVTPTTTPLDLIKSAATCLTEPIDVRTAVILECFQKVGVQRPMRNYEHVRDVMNSWDDDKQNDLLIVHSLAQNIDQRQLLASQVPDEKPEGMGCYINYSSKPGKWSKRYFTLTTDGQLTMGKSENAKDQENICHLSDFDIYSPSERKLSKVKPPKKICYAVKSQQKSNIYLDETRFVHFFCTNDRNTASLFYNTLHSWRSWYLIHVMGEGQKKTTVPSRGNSASRNVSGYSDQGPAAASHMRGASVGSHYQLGSFQPLADLDQFNKEPKEEGYVTSLARRDTKSMHARKMSTRAKGPPPLSYNLGTLPPDNGPPTSKSTSRERDNSVAPSTGSGSDNDAFAPGGLLGRKYSQRKAALQEKESKHQGAFTEGSSLISNVDWNNQMSGNDSGINRRSSVRSNHPRASGDLQRNISTRVKPKPLIDLTPQYRAPPQHCRKGKAFIPEANTGPLIENATSIEEAIPIPPSSDWRARPSTSHRPAHGTYGTGGYERTRSLKGRGEGLAAYTVNNHSGAPEDASAGFTGHGLLAQAGFSQGSRPVGHGVMNGSHAKGPMLDMREAPDFAPGSLLASLPASVEHPQGHGGTGSGGNN